MLLHSFQCARRFAIMAATVAAIASPILPGRSLVESSPFVPADFTPPAERREAPRPASPALSPVRELDFIGVYSLDGAYYVNIFDKREQKGSWNQINDPGSKYDVVAYDESSGTITLNIEGSMETLTMKAPTNQPIQVQTAPAAVSNATAQASTPAVSRRSTRSTENRPVVRRRIITPRRSSGSSSSGSNPGGGSGSSNQDQNQQNQPRSPADVLRQIEASRNN